MCAQSMSTMFIISVLHCMQFLPLFKGSQSKSFFPLSQSLSADIAKKTFARFLRSIQSGGGGEKTDWKYIDVYKRAAFVHKVLSNLPTFIDTVQCKKEG